MAFALCQTNSYVFFFEKVDASDIVFYTLELLANYRYFMFQQLSMREVQF